MSAVGTISRFLRSLERLAPPLAAEVAYWLWFAPGPRKRIHRSEALVMAQARTSALRIGRTRVPVYTWGDGEHPLLLVHGWRGRAAELAEFVRELRSEGRTVIAFDAPNHGAAGRGKVDIQVYAQIMKKLQDRFGHFEAIVAHSLGSPAATLAIRQGVRTSRLVSIGGVAEMDYLADTFGQALRLRPQTIDGVRERVQRRRFRNVPDSWKVFSSTGSPVGVPFLIIHDTDDPVVAIAQAHALASAHPEAVSLTTSGLGHTRILRDDSVLDAVSEFVNARELHPSATDTQVGAPQPVVSLTDG